MGKGQKNNSITRKVSWWDEECRQAIKQTNIASMICFQQNTRANQEHYKEKRKEVNKVCKQKNKQCLTTK